MYKRICYLLVFSCLAPALLYAQPEKQEQTYKFDPTAVSLLDRMSKTMGELKSCSATVRSCYDVGSDDLGLIKHTDVEHVYIGGPDRLMVRSEGDKGSRYIQYDGNTLSYYSLDRNHYAQVKVPPSVVNMIDYMNKTYGIVFPMADFLYPAFVDDIISESDNLVLLGTTKVDGKDCFHIAGRAKDKTFQFWIADDPFYLPVKMVIVYTNKPMNPQFEAQYTDWQINPELPDGIFEFKAPPDARKIKLAQLSARK